MQIISLQTIIKIHSFMYLRENWKSYLEAITIYHLLLIYAVVVAHIPIKQHVFYVLSETGFFSNIPIFKYLDIVIYFMINSFIMLFIALAIKINSLLKYPFLTIVYYINMEASLTILYYKVLIPLMSFIKL